MATSGDVEMADAERSPARATARDVLDCLTTGRIDALLSFAPSADSQHALEASGDSDNADAERELLTPFLPLLTRIHQARNSTASSTSFPSPLAALLGRYDAVNELMEYTTAIETLTLADIESFAVETTDATPVYRQFEAADARERACIVLHLVLAFSSHAVAKDALHENELVRNDIYKPHLVAILVNALAFDGLTSSSNGVSIQKVVAFCLAVPLGVELIEAIVLNDPSCFREVVDIVVRSIHRCNPLQATSGDAVISGLSALLGSLVASSSSLLPFELRQAQATCSTLAALTPSYAIQIAHRLRDDITSVAAAFVAFQLMVELPSLRGDDHFYATFVLQWLRRSAHQKSTGSPALHVFLQAALSREGDAPAEQDKATQTVAASFLEEARYVMSQFRQFLIEDMVQFRLTPSTDAKTPSRFAFTAMVSTLIGFLVVGHLHPEDHETTQLLKLFDKVTKEIPQLQPPVSVKNFERTVTLMYVLVLLLCAPSAPQFAKMPSQREDSTKLVLQLAQQCVYSLYNTKAACPLFVLSSVLLYTKSPSFLPFLNSLLGDTFPIVPSMVRVEHLHGVGDAILKPILTENVMAREVLTVFEPTKNVSAKSHDMMEEMVLRSIHGLLSEKSFLRHHHARKLEEWITLLLDRATTPVHPLIVSVLFEWIENYVMAFEYPVTQRPLLQLAVTPLSPAFVNRSLGHTAMTKPFNPTSQKEWARATLVLIYALQFNQRMRLSTAMPGTKLFAFANQAPVEGTDQNATTSLRGSGDIVLSYDLTSFPVKQILTQVSRFAEIDGMFEFATPTLVRLAMEEFPHLMIDHGFGAQSSLCRVRSDHRKHKLLLVSSDNAASTPNGLPVVSWMSACMWLREMHSARSVEVDQVVDYCVNALVPLAILSLGTTASDDFGPEPFLSAFSEFYLSRAFSESGDPFQLDRKFTEALCMPQRVWRHYQQAESRKKTLKVSENTRTSSPSLLNHDQLIEQPFYVLHHAYADALSSLPLLRLSLGVVTRLRELSIFQLNRREVMMNMAKKVAQASEAANGGATTALPPPSNPATQQFLMIQDCILIQSMLGLVAKFTTTRAHPEKEQCIVLLYEAIEHLLVENKAKTSPPLALVIHSQGYDPSLVTSFVDRAPSLKQLWTHWMHQPAADVGAAKGSNDRRSGNSNTPSHSGTKAITDFVGDSAVEKDFMKWQFRVRVFFKLCEKYFSASAHTAVVMPTMKQILNRLRGIAVSSSGSNKGVLHARGIGDNAARVAFVEAVLADAIDGCGPYPDLRTELAQFLLSLKKHLGSAVSQNQAASSPKSVDVGGPRRTDHQQDVERVVFRAYKKVVQLA